MSTQTLTIVDTLDDGYEDPGNNWSSALLYIGATGDVAAAGFSFLATSAITAGSTVDSAYLRVFITNDTPSTNTYTISVENADPTSNTRFSATHKPAAATVYTGAATSAVIGVDHQNRYWFGLGDDIETAITAGIQSLVTDFGGIAIGERINIRITATGGGYASCQDSAAGTNDPGLTINWTAGAGQVTHNTRAFPLGMKRGINRRISG